MGITILISEITLMIYGLIAGDFTFNFNKDTGLFGFFHKELVLYAFFVVGFFTGAVSIWTSG